MVVFVSILHLRDTDVDYINALRRDIDLRLRQTGQIVIAVYLITFHIQEEWHWSSFTTPIRTCFVVTVRGQGGGIEAVNIVNLVYGRKMTSSYMFIQYRLFSLIIYILSATPPAYIIILHKSTFYLINRRHVVGK